MRTEREHYVTIVVAIIAIVVIVGGFASFTGLSVQEEPIRISMEKNLFRQGEIFDVNVLLSPVTFFADESIVIYIDNKAVGAIALRKYLDDNGLEYGTEVKNLGQNNIEIITLMQPVSVSLADFITLDYMHPGTTHLLRVEFSRGDAVAEDVFRIE